MSATFRGVPLWKLVLLVPNLLCFALPFHFHCSIKIFVTVIDQHGKFQMPLLDSLLSEEFETLQCLPK